ncbi:MAG: 3-deoxy-manno-octulosonate cytidylyltransferase [Kiritimatiellaeota bacterium]|nr:3-deoxy-manno-octulosonate cytidylyltransferase [Kiritimatiellota bacterium]
MRVIGVIPSRWGSTRFPGKSLHQIYGKPLVQWVVESARQARLLDELIVATDDGRIAEAVQGLTRVVMTRPDHPSGTDRVAEAADAGDDDIVINIQGDEPLISPSLIDALAKRMTSSTGWAMATAACPIRSLLDLEAQTVVKVVVAQDGGALYFSRLPIPCQRDGAPDLWGGLYLRHVGIYAYRGDFLKRLVAEPPCALEKAECLEQLRALYLGGRIAVIQTDEPGIGVDTPHDVATVEKLLRATGRA